MYYFAYGSNMNHKQMKRRCPDSCFLKTAYLNNAEFRYDGVSGAWDDKAVANIVSNDGEKVWGGLFEASENDLAKLDRHEGFPKSYGKKVVQVIDAEGSTYDAWVYFRIGETKGDPSEEYRKVVLEGASNCNLPEDYIKRNI
jgi:gamma-glutamylcyclotransferase (GGCT)/AIG2-like uncharacterized protein YtfP